FIRKAAQAIPSLKDPRRFLAYQTVVGDLRTYWVVTPLDSLADLDRMLPPHELLQRAFGAEGSLIYRTALDHIEHYEREISTLRPERSTGTGVNSSTARTPDRRAARPGAH